MFKSFPEVKVHKEALPDIADLKRDPLATVLAEDVDGPVMSLKFPSMTKVIVDVQAALRLVKHARDGGARIVTGSLTGMQFGTVGEITNAVPYVSSADAEDEGKKDREEHQQLLSRLSEVGMDRFPIGRYVCCAQANQLAGRQLSMLEACVRNGEPSVLLAYDPLRTALGRLHLKAYVLGDAYLKALREDIDAAKRTAEEAAEAIAGNQQVQTEERRNRVRDLGGEDLLKEIPVEMYANALQQQLLAQLAQQPRNVKNEIIANHDLGRVMERGLTSLGEGLERLRADVYSRHVRHREESSVPLRPEAHVLAQQLKDQASHLNSLALGSTMNLDFARKVAEQQQQQ